jgi:hypothetical protein
MGAFAFGVCVGFGIVAIVVAPLCAPWRMRVRWLVASQADPMSGLGPWSHLSMQEVTVTDVVHAGDVTEITVVESDARRRRFLVTASAHAGSAARLEGWCAVREPLLLLLETTGEAQLSGPDATLVGLRDVSERV